MPRVATLLLLFTLVGAACSPADEESAPPAESSTTSVTEQERTPTYEQTILAPDFPPGLDWINTDGPLSIESLRGKIVLLDFWTYGCINCIHVIDDLKRLEEEYAEELVVIGVHSAKFANEGETENIRQVVLRYGIEHPVVNDKDFAVWSSWAAQAWPTVALVDPDGYVVGSHTGEGVYAVVKPVIEQLLEDFAGDIDTTPQAFAPDDRAPTALSFPGKVLAEPGSDRLFIADTGNNRIVAADAATGEVTSVYGSGSAGLADGTGLGAQFSAPQGMALSADGMTLYVADTGNHAIRVIDLRSGAVTTFAGSGVRGGPEDGGTLADAVLASPWALEREGSTLYIANAGTHQIWAADLERGTVGPLVGNGRESTKNGAFGEAELAQPSGLALANGVLYFADSESSSIRAADLARRETSLVAGADSSLFDFGDVDGAGSAARLQHPLGLAWHRGRLLVADTYNSKIKALEGGTVTTLFGGAGWRDGPDPLFFEPGGLSVRGDTLYVADTNNHVIRVVDLVADVTTTLVLSGIERFTPSDAAYTGTVVTVEAQSVGAGTSILRLDVALPDGYKVNDQAPSSLSLSTGERFDLTGTRLPAEVAVEFSEGGETLVADLVLIYCREGAESLCLIEQVRFEIPLEVAAEGPSGLISLPHTVIVPDV